MTHAFLFAFLCSLLALGFLFRKSLRLQKELQFAKEQRKQLETELAHHRGEMNDIKQLTDDQAIYKTRLDLALEASNTGLWDIQPLDDQSFYNDQWFRQLGYDPEDFKGQNPFFQLLYPGDKERIEKSMMENPSGLGEHFEHEFRLKAADGSWKWVLSIGKIISLDENGKVQRIIGVHLDIDERKKIVEELNLNKQRLDLALEASNTGLWDVKPLKNEFYYNEQWFRQLGYKSEEFTESPFLKLIHPEDADRVEDILNEDVILTGKPYEVDFRLKCKDGSWKWILSIGKVIEVDPIGNVERVIGVHLDIDERKKMEQEIKINQRRMDLALEASNTGLWDLKPFENTLFLNDQWYQQLGYHPGIFQDNPDPFQKLLHPDDQERVYAAIDEHLANKNERYQQEFRLKSVDGSWKWILSVGKAMERNEQGDLSRVIGVHTDITTLKQTELALETALVNEKKAYDELKQTKIELAETEAVASMTKVFEKFVPKQFLNRIAKEGIENIELGKAENDIITILCSDIRSFTNLSEQMDPQELLDFLNEYLRRMNVPIHKHHGFVDKFIGDAIMTLFDQPERSDAFEAMNAIQTAIGMQHAVQEFNQERGRQGYAPIAIGIGIHTGNVIFGTVGSKDRMDSTVLGDDVNIAFRLERLTKHYDVDIIVSYETFIHLEHDVTQFQYRELDQVTVKGKSESISIYEVYDHFAPETQKLKSESGKYILEGLVHRRLQSWDKATHAFEKALAVYPEDTTPERHLHYIQKLKDLKLLDDWDGSVQLYEK